MWTLDLDAPPVTLAVAEATLVADERERAGRFLLEHDRRRFTLARGGLRLLLGEYLQQEPAAVVLRRSTAGKPILAADGGSGPRFNLSHSGARVVYAFAVDRDLGVDIERMRPMADATQIARACFSDAEQAAVLSLRGSRRLLAFYRCWTRKEAWLKALGVGLTRPLPEVDAGAMPQACTRVLDSAWAAGRRSLWTLSDLTVAAGYVAALAVEGRPPAIRRWSLGACGAWTTAG